MGNLRPVNTFKEPSQESLEAKRLNFLKECKPKTYREMKKDGDLQEHLTAKANAARRYAENLVASGVWAGEAWNMAIRSELLESGTD